MKKHILFIAASMAVLTACGGRDAGAGNNQAENAATGAVVSSNASGGETAPQADQNGSAAETRTAADPNIAAEIEREVAAIQSRLPINQGGMSITAMEANGNEIITTMEMPVDLNEAAVQMMRTQMPAQACSNPQVRPFLDRGAIYTYRIKDSGGEEFRVSVDHC